MDEEFSLFGLSAGYIHPETEGFAGAIQDRVIKTKNYVKHCLGAEVLDRYRKCDEVGETTELLIAACPSLSAYAYLGRHNQLAETIHQRIVIKYKLLDRN